MAKKNISKFRKDIMIKRAISLINILVLMLLSFGLTAFITLNSYEIIFNKDLPYIDSVKSFNSTELIDVIGEVDAANFADVQAVITKTHKPKAIRFTSLKLRLELLPAIKQDGYWLEISNKGHFIFLGESGESGVGDGIVYLSSDWRTVREPEELLVNDNFYLETETYTNLYKIVETGTRRSGENYIINKLNKPYILIVIEDKENHTNHFLKGIFVAKELNNI